MSNDQKIVSISPIPLSKLAVVMNNFIANTITHLNKLSVKGDEKLAEFDNKLNDLDAMTTLLEAKLNSLPEKYTSAYPPLEKTSLDDLYNSPNVDIPDVPIPPPIVPPEPGGGEDMSPEEALENFLQKNEDYRSLYKMLKIGITINQVQQKVTMNGLDMDIFNELITFAKNVLPNIH